MTALLESRALQVSIAGKTICRALDLTIEPGQSWALLGRNGVGKTTLLHHLAGLRQPERGRVTAGGSDLANLPARERARRISVLLQHGSRGFGASVRETVLSGRHPHLPALAWEGADDLEIAAHAIEATGLTALAERSLDTLSGGELRRVEIARLLTQQCPLALLDEPLNHLDLGYQATTLETLRAHCVGDGRAMLMVIHDLNVAWHACDHWLILDGEGDWQAGPRAAMASPQRLSAAYGHPVERIESAAGPVFRPRL